MKKIFIIIFNLYFLSIYAQWNTNDANAIKYADSVYQVLTPKERIAQLLMIPVYANKNIKHIRQISKYVKEYNIGGMILMQGSPLKFASYINYFQKLSHIPLLMSIDAEWGVSMRWDSMPVYPKQMTLGAIENDSLIYQMGLQIGKECKRLGIHINFAPVVDINNNPNNPVIGVRSFGENKYLVTQKAWLYAKGLMDAGVMPVIKHFPGHGDTDVDSHKDLPIINHSKERLDTIELYPFKTLIKKGIPAIMIAHLNIPALDTSKNRPSTLSKKIVTDLLKTELGFEGLIFTDAMSMKGVTKYFPEGVAEVEAIKAGNDVLLFSLNVPKVIDSIQKALNDSVITWQQIEERCKKILKYKYLLNIRNNQFVRNKKHLYSDICAHQIPQILIKNISENAVTLVQNKNNFLPIKNLKEKKFIYLTVGDSARNSFTHQLSDYIIADKFFIINKNNLDTNTFAAKFENTDIVFIHFIQKKLFNRENGNEIDSIIPFIENIAQQKKAVLVISGSPYLLNKFRQINSFQAIIYAYENKKDLSKSAVNVIFGSINPKGKTPVSNQYIPASTKITYDKTIRLPEILPEEIHISSESLHQKVDSVIYSAIRQKVFPGCQIVAVKDGKIFFKKSYGRFTYDDTSTEVTNSTLYDIASVTKIASSAMALMKLVSEKKLDVKKTLEYYLPELKNSNKGNLVIEDILTHQAGLLPYIPFYQKALSYQKTNRNVFQKDSSAEYSIKVAKNLWMKNEWKDTLWSDIINSPLKNKGKYVYSDLGYYFMQKIVEKLTGQTLDEYVSKNFYQDMNLGLTYNPLQYYSKEQIAPTEIDTEFRKQLLQGYVHDPGAAMMGGVAGHAGLFANATDLATLFQMMLNKGELFGQRYLDSNVIKEFTKCRFCPDNRRGLCFEKPSVNKNTESPVPDCCSPDSYGHFGFTGTMVWVEPQENLIVVFLSNRVYPDAKENKLAKLGIRGNILKIFYDAVKHYYPFGFQ